MELSSHGRKFNREGVVTAGKRMITGVDPFLEQLCVLPEADMAADLKMIAVFAHATSLGDVKQNPACWERTLNYPKASDQTDEDLDVAGLPDKTPFEFSEWFGEDAFDQIPLARLRTAELCPPQILAEFGKEDHEVGFVGYEPARWLRPADRDAIEQRLASLGFQVERRDADFARYLEV